MLTAGRREHPSGRFGPHRRRVGSLGCVDEQPPLLVCSAETAGDGIVLVPVGELDAFVAPNLRELLRRTIADDAYRIVVVDLSGVTFLDSAILGTLVGGLRQAKERGSEFRLVFPPGSARRIFELTSLDRVLPDYRTRERALA